METTTIKRIEERPAPSCPRCGNERDLVIAIICRGTGRVRCRCGVRWTVQLPLTCFRAPFQQAVAA